MTAPNTTNGDSSTAGTTTTCPLCHAAKGATAHGGADGWWRCTRCGQAWTDFSLATVHAYAASERARSSAAALLERPGPRLVPTRT
jgi:ribosomal protein L37AE/L43A